jgi:mono/diheme cytochrome c family protein
MDTTAGSGISAALLALMIAALVAVTPARAQLEESAPKAAGDPVQGRALYIGAVALAAGGAPCLACHGVAGAGLGMASGASYGVDLTSMYDNYGAEGVLSILEDLSTFPSMAPIYAGRPLSATEQADMTAFLAEVAGQPPVQAGAQVAGHVAVGGVLIGVLLVLFGWSRLNGVRQPLVNEAGKGRGEPR